MRSAALYEKLDNQAVRCQVCAHYCVISRNSAGLCGVRYNDEGKLFLTVYGRPSAINIDPIEKKPFYHFLPGTKIFSLGTVGCNFGCDFCQNWDISQITKSHGRPTFKISGEDWSPERIVDYCLKNRLPSIAYTYNEPTIFAEYVYDTALLAKEKGIKNALVSNGYQSKESLNYLAPVIDAINIDLKAGNEKFYLQTCKAKLSIVKENIQLWKEKGVWVEITSLVIPGHNDEEKELKEMARFIAKIDKGIPWHLSRFFPQFRMADGAITPLSTLKKAYAIGQAAGLKYVYIGNVSGGKFEHTLCSGCRDVIIERENYTITKNNLKDGKCPICQEKIEGVWK